MSGVVTSNTQSLSLPTPPVPPSFTFNDLEFVTFSPIFCAVFAGIFVKIKCLNFILFSATQISPAGDL